MKTHRFIIGGTAFCLLVLCSIVLAQRPGGPQGQIPGGPQRGPGQDGRPDGPRPPRQRPEGALDFASIEMLGGGRLVKGIPYTADAVIETTQVLRDGTSITRKSITAVARDGEGRLRRERSLDSIGPFKTADGPRTLIVIDDPVLGSHFVFDVENKTVRKIRNPHPPDGPEGPPRDMDDQRGEFAEGKVESIGTKTIEGVEAEGTRSTITIPVGTIGNDRIIEIVSERWYSPSLQAVLISKHSDPRMGDTTYRLTNIKRAEPDASLFRIPSDYKVVEGGPPPRGPEGPGGPGSRGGPGGPGGRGGPGGPGMRPIGPPPKDGRAPGARDQ